MIPVCQRGGGHKAARRRWRLAAALVCVAGALLGGLGHPGGASQPAGADRAPFEFALMGDAPYSALEEIAFEAMMGEIDRAGLAFVVHVGDFKSSRMPCSDELFGKRLALFQRSAHPFVFVFGDNEWTDCHLPAAGGYDPVERLARLRELFAANDQSLGRRTMTLERQSAAARWAKFRENVRWRRGGVVFVGLNIPGSNNNLGRTRAGNAEYTERNAADLAWMEDSFTVAIERGAVGILLAIQADPYFELARGHPRRSGYESFLAGLERQTARFARPVVLVHGDSHVFRIDRPLVDATGRRVENLTRVEVFGSPVVSWVRGRVVPDSASVFSFEPEPSEPRRGESSPR